MSRIVEGTGKSLRELQSRIRLSYGDDAKVKIIAVIVEVVEQSKPLRKVVLRASTGLGQVRKDDT